MNEPTSLWRERTAVTCGTPTRRVWRGHYYLSLVAAICGPTHEAVVFAHDRLVVGQDFACLEEHLAAESKTLDPSSDWDSYPACHIRSRKPFGWYSTRAWRNGLPSLLLSLDESDIEYALWSSLPFLLLVSTVFLRRSREHRVRKILLVGAAVGMVAVVTLHVYPSWDALKTIDDPDTFSRVLYSSWWTIRGASLLYLAFAWMIVVRDFAIHISLRKVKK